jgi:hypothetical protein
VTQTAVTSGEGSAATARLAGNVRRPVAGAVRVDCPPADERGDRLAEVLREPLKAGVLGLAQLHVQVADAGASHAQ